MVVYAGGIRYIRLACSTNKMPLAVVPLPVIVEAAAAAAAAAASGDKGGDANEGGGASDVGITGPVGPTADGVSGLTNGVT